MISLKVKTEQLFFTLLGFGDDFILFLDEFFLVILCFFFLFSYKGFYH